MSGGNKPSKDTILEAINSLKARNCDVNAYSVAQEANVPRALIIRDRQLMQLLSDSRVLVAVGSPTNGHKNAPEAASISEDDTSTEAKLRHKLDHLHFVESELRQQLQRTKASEADLKQKIQKCVMAIKALRDQVEMARGENAQLQTRIADLQQENQNIAKSINIAWQQGYLAGQNAAMNESAQTKSFVDTLAEAAQAATAFGGNLDEEDAAAEAEEAPDSTPYVANVALPLDDPEVLNDPFTAKLLNALSEEQPFEQPETFEEQTEAGAEQEQMTAPEPSEVPPPAPAEHAVPPPLPTTSFTPTEPVEMIVQPGSLVYEDQPAAQVSYEDPSFDRFPQSNNPNQTTPMGSYDQFSCVPDGLQLDEQQQTQQSARTAVETEAPPADEAEAPKLKEGESTQTFTAEELHNLFRNKYVRGADEPMPEPKAASPDPALSGSTHKKFVGSKHVSSEPPPAIQRAYPQDIRKACRLLGINPEEMTRQAVLEAWKKEMAKPGVHPDTGGDTEMAIYLNTAKDTLIRWVEDQTPKLGKKFGSGTRDHQKPKQE